MATVQELTAKTQQLQGRVDAAQARAEAVIAQKASENVELQAKADAIQAAYDELVANPNVPNEALTSLQASIDDLDAWIAAPSEPIPDVPPVTP